MLQKVLRNVQTVTGRNVRHIQNKVGQSCDLLKASDGWIKSKVRFCEISSSEMWRVNMIREITNINQNVLMFNCDEENFLSRDQLQDIVDFISTS